MDFKDLRELKDIKSWSFDELDDAIGSRKKIIDDLNKDVRKLREVKWQKVCDEMKSRVVDSDVDFSPESLNQFFLKSADAEAEVKPAKPKSKSSRSKKDTEKSEDKDVDDDAHSADVVVKNSSPEKTAEKTVSENSAPEEKLTTEEANVPNENLQSKVTAEKIAAEDTNVPAEIPEPETTSEEISNPNVAEKKNETGSSVSPTATEIGNQNTDALNNPDEEIFEEVTTPQPEKSSIKELKVIAKSVGLPETATLAEVRQVFDVSKNAFPLVIADSYENVLGKLERGEIA